MCDNRGVTDIGLRFPALFTGVHLGTGVMTAVRQADGTIPRLTNRLIRESRRQHYVDKLSTTDDNSHQRWQVIKELLHADDHPTNSDTIGSQRICDEFFTFFTNKIAHISAKIKDMITRGTLSKMTKPCTPCRNVWGNSIWSPSKTLLESTSIFQEKVRH